MPIIDLLNFLTAFASKYHLDASEDILRSSHMHKCNQNVTQDVIDAVLVGFINDIASRHCVDYALYAEDLYKK